MLFFVNALSILLLIKCDNQKKHQTDNDSSQEIKKHNTIVRDIHQIEQQPSSIAWTDSGSFWLLTFKPEKVIFAFNPSCVYWFPSKVINNEIIFYWEINEDCNFDRGLTKTFLKIKNPEKGEPFGKIKIVNDSLLNISYYYKDWVRKINIEENATIDTLFPSSFKKIKLDW